MKKYLIIVLLLLSATAYGFGGLMMGSGTATTSAACSTSISDDFSGTLSKWAEIDTSGQWSIVSGQAEVINKSVLIYTDEQTCVAGTQWAMVKVDLTPGDVYAGLYFRSQNDETTYAYAVRYEEWSTPVRFGWRYCGGAVNSDVAGNCVTIATWERTLTDDDYYGVEITGTGTGTVVKIYDLGTTAKNYSNWASSADASTTLTDNPAYEANTGKYVGLYSGSSGDAAFDDFEAGSE